MTNEATANVPLTHATPTMFGEINDNEDIPGKKRLSRDLRACPTVRRNLGTKFRKPNRWRLNCARFFWRGSTRATNQRSLGTDSKPLDKLTPKSYLLLFLPKTALSFGQATALWVKRRSAHVKDISKNLSNSVAGVSRATRGATSHVVSKSSSGFIQLLPFFCDPWQRNARISISSNSTVWLSTSRFRQAWLRASDS
jgi:hypothetical protein